MGARMVCEFLVDGVPVPQGSKNAWVNKGTGKAVMYDQNTEKLAPWRQRVSYEARQCYNGDRIEGPVLLVVEFRFLRPKSVRREFPAVKPDVDKLLRALCDGITDSGIWRDDAQVVTCHVKKVYADRAGVHVQVGEFPTTHNSKEKAQ
jgi:Holliday junction resolvase RusA-like endonuclease